MRSVERQGQPFHFRFQQRCSGSAGLGGHDHLAVDDDLVCLFVTRITRQKVRLHPQRLCRYESSE